MSHRRMTPKGGMASNGSGPAIMMMKDHIRATFMPNPPLKFLPLIVKKRRWNKTVTDGGKAKEREEGSKDGASASASASAGTRSSTVVPSSNVVPLVRGVSHLMVQFERTASTSRLTRPDPVAARRRRRREANEKKLEPLIESYRQWQKEPHPEGMNSYNTLFVGRLAYETTERRLLRDFETFGPVKDVKLIHTRTVINNGSGSGSEKNNGGSKSTSGVGVGESRGYAFVEYENEEDMKRAYRAADGMRIDGREIVVDVERGHTVPNWLPRRLGGGLGGTRLGGKDRNITHPGRYDPSKQQPPPAMLDVPVHGMGGGGPPPNYGPPHGYPGGPGGGHPPYPPIHPNHHPHYPPMGGMSGMGRGGGGHPPPMGGGGPPPGMGPGGPYRPPRGGGSYGGGPPPRERERERDRDRDRERDRERERYSGPPPPSRERGGSFGHYGPVPSSSSSSQPPSRGGIGGGAANGGGSGSGAPRSEYGRYGPSSSSAPSRSSSSRRNSSKRRRSRSRSHSPPPPPSSSRRRDRYR